MKIKGLGDVPSAFSQKAPVPDHPTVRTGLDRAFRARFLCPDEQARTVSVLLVDESGSAASLSLVHKSSSYDGADPRSDARRGCS
jgi:hypothetical protein